MSPVPRRAHPQPTHSSVSYETKLTCQGFVASAFVSTKLKTAVANWRLARPTIGSVYSTITAMDAGFYVVVRVQDGTETHEFDYSTHRYEEPSEGLQKVFRLIEAQFSFNDGASPSK